MSYTRVTTSVRCGWFGVPSSLCRRVFHTYEYERTRRLSSTGSDAANRFTILALR